MYNNNNNNNHRKEACEACRYQRRKCEENCKLAPYFTGKSKRKDLLNAGKLFGISKMKQHLDAVPVDKRDDAMAALVYTANARASQPVSGCYFYLQELTRRLSNAQAELDHVLAQLAAFQAADGLGPGHIGSSGVGSGDGSGSVLGQGSDRFGHVGGEVDHSGTGLLLGSSSFSSLGHELDMSMGLPSSSSSSSCFGLGDVDYSGVGLLPGSSSFSSSDGEFVDSSMGLLPGSSSFSGLGREIGGVTQMDLDDGLNRLTSIEHSSEAAVPNEETNTATSKF